MLKKDQGINTFFEFITYDRDTVGRYLVASPLEDELVSTL